MWKVCNGCLERKPIEDYGMRNRKTGLRHARCKQCLSERNARYWKTRTLRVCSRCGEEKLIPQAKTTCTDCLNAKHTEWKERNKAWMRAYARQRSKQRLLDPIQRKFRNQKNKERRRTNQQIVYEILARSGCVSCGTKFFLALDFDHVLGTKLDNVACMMTCNIDKIMREIAKCEVRCANCHRERTLRTMNAYRYQWWLENQDRFL